MFGEIKSKMVQLFGTSPGRQAVTSDGNWRSVPVTSNGLLTDSRTTFWPVTHSNQTLAVTAVSNRSLGLYIGKEHILWSTVPCHIVFGGTSVVALGTDAHIPANVLFPFIPLDGITEYKLAVLKSTLIVPAPADGLLFIFQSER